MPVRKVSRCQQELLVLIHKVAEILNLGDIDFTIHFGCDDIDSFSAGIFSVEIRGSKNGQKIKQSVVIKWHSDRRMRLALREAYIHEVTFYQKIVPRYLELQQNLKIIQGLRIKFPNCIYTSDEYGKETVVVMSLSQDGYIMRSRFLEMDSDHVVLVIKYLAKLHALSFAYEKSAPEDFEFLKQSYGKDAQHSNPNRECGPMKRFFGAAVDVVSDPIYKQKLKELTPHILSILYESTLPIPHYSTICHADCWNNNILFKYKGKKPVDVLLIDFQLTRYASPVTDIAYFLYMSTEGTFLLERYDCVIDIYYATLIAVLRECNLNGENIYPKEIFLTHLKEYSVFGLVEALISMMIITAPPEEALKMTEIKDQFCDEGFIESPCNTLFKSRVNCIVDHFFSKNYSLDSVLFKVR